MNKNELIDIVADRADISKSSASHAVDAMLGAITEAMQKQEKVTLVGFGTFEVRHRKARTGRNPSTGAQIEIKASNSPSFKAGKALKDAVN